MLFRSVEHKHIAVPETRTACLADIWRFSGVDVHVRAQIFAVHKAMVARHANILPFSVTAVPQLNVRHHRTAHTKTTRTHWAGVWLIAGMCMYVPDERMQVSEAPVTYVWLLAGVTTNVPFKRSTRLELRDAVTAEVRSVSECDLLCCNNSLVVKNSLHTTFSTPAWRIRCFLSELAHEYVLLQMWHIDGAVNSFSGLSLSGCACATCHFSILFFARNAGRRICIDMAAHQCGCTHAFSAKDGAELVPARRTDERLLTSVEKLVSFE